MLEKFGRAAEHMALGLSRRQALGRLGRGALGIAGALAGLSLLGGQAQAKGNICSPNSPNGCANQPVGTPCLYSPGKCWSYPKQYDAAGQLICNVCKEHKTKDH